MKESSPFFLASFFLLSSLESLETKPWFSEVYEFTFDGTYNFSRFSKVQGASRQLSSPLNNQGIFVDLGFAPDAPFDFQIEGELGKTTSIGWTFRSAAIQARYRLLDDIAGDPISLVFGFIFRGATPHFLTDVSTPYAGELNTEATCSIGKEWAEGEHWLMRTYGFLSLGQSNQGYPWTRQLLVWQYNLYDEHRFTLFAQGDIGFGGKHHVDVKHFKGWGKLQHQSIDLGLSYGYRIGVYGVLTAAYAHRIFAHNFPERVNFFTLSYHLPFSLF